MPAVVARVSKLSQAAAFASLAVVLAGCAASTRSSLLADVAARRFDRALGRYEMLRVDDGPDPELLALLASALLEHEILTADAARKQAALAALISAGTAGDASLRIVAAQRADEASRLRALRTLASRGDLDARAELERLGESPEHAYVARAAPLSIDEAGLQLARLLVAPFTMESALSLARAINALPPEHALRVQAEDLLARKLDEASPADRNAALAAAASLSDRTPVRFALLRRVTAEPDLRSFLRVMSLVLDDERARNDGRQRLESMLEHDSPDAVDAMRLLHTLGDPRAAGRLEMLLRAPDPAVRKLAAFTLARDAAMPDRARAGLADADAFVRISAAHGILAHESRRGF